jgi:hypothetical protein
MRAMPPEALGIESKRAGREGGTRHHPPLLHGFAVCWPRRDVLARKVKLLAHDIKPIAGCLLNPDCCFQPVRFRLRATCDGDFPIRFRTGGAVKVCTAPIARPTGHIPEPTMCAIFNPTSGRLRVTQAFIALSSMPGSNSTQQYATVLRVGEYEIRLFNGAPSRSGDASLAWMELFDHDANRTVDSCSCREIDDAVSAFEEFVSQAKSSNEACGPKADDAQD